MIEREHGGNEGCDNDDGNQEDTKHNWEPVNASGVGVECHHLHQLLVVSRPPGERIGVARPVGERKREQCVGLGSSHSGQRDLESMVFAYQMYI